MARPVLRQILALGLLGCLSARAALGASPVWAVRGAHNTVYLAASVHMLRPDESQLPAAFDRAYADSARLIMELDLARFDPMEAMSWMMEHGSLPPGTRLRTVLGESRYTRVSTAAAGLGIPLQAMDGLAPWVVGIELTDAAYTHEGFDPDQGVEEQLLRRAQADHRQTAGLENIQEELGGLVGLSQADQVRMLDQTLDELKDIKSEMIDVVGAWQRGDAPRLAALLGEEYQSFPTLYKPLVTERNRRWLPQIEALLKGDGNALVVVGALHLVGDGGLLELLRHDGYTARQLD